MKRIAVLLFSFVLMTMGASTLSAQGKYGADSAECIKYLSYYQEYFKQKNYKDATPHWRSAIKLCPPTANHNMWINGTTLIRNLINQNKNNVIYRKALVDTLMMLHDIRRANYPKYSVTVLNNKGLDIINYIKDDDKEIYEGLSEIIRQNGVQSKPQIFLFQLNSAVNLYKSGLLGAEDVIGGYEEAVANLDGMTATAKEYELNTINDIKSKVEELFISSKVADCENLIALYTPRLDAEPNNLDLAKKIVKMLSSTDECTDNSLFIKAATTMYNLEPSYTSAYFCYKLYSSIGSVEMAIALLQEAINFEESDAEMDADYYFELAQYCFKEGKTVQAYNSVQKALEFDADKSITAKAYMLAGTIWGSTVCKGNEIETRAPYWVAVDYLKKARAMDETLAEDCNRMIAQYRNYFPHTAEAFMHNLTDGQSYTVSCNGMRATTTVQTQK